MDMARGCRVKLFREEDYPDGVGDIKNVDISDVHVNIPADPTDERIHLLGNVKYFSMTDVVNENDHPMLLSVGKLAPHTFSMTRMRHATVETSPAEGLVAGEDSLGGTLAKGDVVTMRLSAFETLKLSEK